MKDVGAPLPLRTVAALSALACASWIVLVEPSGPPPAFPALARLELGGRGCAYPAEEASSRAKALELAALTRMARYAFNPGEGVEAARLMDEALSCARTAGDLATLAPIEATVRRWKDRLEADYRSRVVRVKVALDREVPAVALREVKKLRRLLGRSSGDYVRWLERQELRLEHGGERE